MLSLPAGDHHQQPGQLESAGHLLIPWIKSTVEARAATDPGPGSSEQQGGTTTPPGAGRPLPCTCRQWWERFLEKRSQPNTQYPGKDGKSESQGLAESILPREPNSPNWARDPRTRSQIQTMDSLLCATGMQVICLSVPISRTRAAAISPFGPWLTRPGGRTTRWKNGRGGLPSPLRAVCLPPSDLGGRQRGRGQYQQPRPYHRRQQLRIWEACV